MNTNLEILIAGVVVGVSAALWVLAARHARTTVIKRISIISGASAVVSLILASLLRTVWCFAKSPWGYVLLTIWVIAPPLWFFLEYLWWPPAAGHADERTRHFHDLARNLWLALVVILGVIMEIPFPGAS